jgi:hypothetical protein
MKKNKTIFAFLGLLVALLFANSALAETYKPTILETTVLKADYGDQVMVKGLSSKNSIVLVYINGSYYGLANISNNDPDLNNFSYLSPVLTGVKNNNYTVLAIARDQETLELSSPAEGKVSSVIEKSYLEKTESIKKPTNQTIKQNVKTDKEEVLAPTLLSPKGNVSTNKPVISGHGELGQKIRLFIDDQDFIEIRIKSDSAGSANFEIQPNTELSSGLHFAYAVAINENGDFSKNSNLLSFIVQNSDGKVYGEKIQNPSINTTTTPNNTALVDKNATSSLASSSSVSQKIGTAFNLSLLIIFAIGAILWVIILKIEDHKKEDEKKI